MIEFRVYGLPVPQGSKKVIRGNLIEMSDARLRSWRQDVAAQAHQAMSRPPWKEAIQIELGFFFPRPKNHYGTGRNSEKLKALAPAYPAVHPDLDKLVRSVLDALSGVCFEDDRQVVFVRAMKQYDDSPGLLCDVGPLEGEPVGGL
jgi:Holliday junction resolvase RusA-like endonuclease